MRIERSWTANLRALYPAVGMGELAGRFLGPWRRVVEQQLSLEDLESALEFGPADSPGWQSLAMAVAATARADCDAHDMGRLSMELSRRLLDAVREPHSRAKSPLHLINPATGGQDTLPERWTARGGLVGSSRTMRALHERCARAARDRYAVLLTGETGCGKEVAAHLIHELSGAGGPFVPVNCAALPESLIESELFGHTRGAFTGATTQREGLIHAAQGGTLFLDEVAELPLAQQAKLLRVLQDGLVRPLGSPRYQQVDVRVVSATNHDLKQILAEGQLRRDLYYRLAVHEIQVPPLREHLEDIPELVAWSLDQWSRTNPRLTPPSFRSDAVELLAKGSWPGNVRQIEHTVYNLASCHAGEIVTAVEVHAVLNRSEPGSPEGAATVSPFTSLRAMEQQAVKGALEAAGGNKAGAARRLGITRKTLYHKIRQYGIALTRR